MPSLMVCCAVFSLLRSQARASGTSSPTCSLPRSCRLGRPSSTKMRSMSQSACFISPMDSLYSFLADRKSTRLNSSHLVISYAVFCLKKKKKTTHERQHHDAQQRAQNQHDASRGHPPGCAL